MRTVIAVVLAILLAAVPAIPQTPPSPSPSGLERSGRWFRYDGRYPYLVGFDLQDPVCGPENDYTDLFDKYQTYHLNSVRVFVYCYWAIDPSNNNANPRGYLFPWSYADGKFNLDAWDDTYWARFRDCVADAKARDIAVEVSIIPSNMVGWREGWSGLAWNRNANVNGAFSANDDGHFFPQFFDLELSEVSTSGRRLVDYQRALIGKTLAELGRFDNVYFEVSNEFPGRFGVTDPVYAWQQTWAQYIHNAVRRPVSAHAQEYYGGNTTGIEYFWDQPYIDVLNFHFGVHGTPREIANLLHAAQLKNKILTNNESLEIGTDYDGVRYDLESQVRFAWGMLLAGGYFKMEGGRHSIAAAAQYLAALRDVAEVAHFWEMSPVDSVGHEYDSLISQGPSGANWRLMANPGSRYLAYFWGSKSSTSVRIALESGSYSYTWYDPRDAAVLGSGFASSEESTTIPVPPTNSWDENVGLALLIWRY